MYGFANWTEVAEHVGTKSKLQCIDHYQSTYISSPCFPLPVSNPPNSVQHYIKCSLWKAESAHYISLGHVSRYGKEQRGTSFHGQGSRWLKNFSLLYFHFIFFNLFKLKFCFGMVLPQSSASYTFFSFFMRSSHLKLLERAHFYLINNVINIHSQNHIVFLV